MNKFDIRDAEEFSRIVSPREIVENLAAGFSFLEGPAWIGHGQDSFLVFSDIPAHQIFRWHSQGMATVFREDSNAANGNTADRQGRLITCEHGTRRVTRTEADGTITVLADKFEGKRLNSPNDVVVKSDDCIYFTDPPYGLRDRSKKELPGHYVFRLNPATGELRIVADDLEMPNGLCFSPDEKLLYIADSGKPHHVRVYDVEADGTLRGGRVFCTIDVGVPDGMRVDPAGRLFCTAGDGVHIFRPTGELIGKILVPEVSANLCFGGAGGKTLFITATHSLYSIRVK